MTRHQVTYTTGDHQNINADTITITDGQYIAYLNNQPIAYIPTGNVLSVIRQGNTDQSTEA
ncbi:hypothetical protein ACWGOK_39085 [Streptomyces eurythermus]